MAGATYFAKPCPACGRTSQIQLQYLGKQVCCKHCGRQFKATDPHNESAAEMDPVNYWINFTEMMYPMDADQFQGSQRYPR